MYIDKRFITVGRSAKNVSIIKELNMGFDQTQHLRSHFDIDTAL